MTKIKEEDPEKDEQTTWWTERYVQLVQNGGW